MLYVTHLSFDTNAGEDGRPWHGYCTFVTEADDVDAALAKVHDLARDIKAEGDVFAEVEALMLDSCIEIKAVPEKGLMAHFQEWDGEATSSISTSLHGLSGDSAEAYHMGPEEDEDAVSAGTDGETAAAFDGDEEEAFHMPPFVEF